MSTFALQLNKLQNVQRNLEKKVVLSQSQMAKINGTVAIKRVYEDVTAKRENEARQLKSVMTNNVILPLRKIKNLIQKDDKKNIDLKTVKQEMTSIKNNIQEIKNNAKISLEVLQKEENKLWREMQVCEQKFGDAMKMRPISQSSTQSLDNITQEVKDFMSFVKVSGGHENRWPLDDHNLFLKARLKTKDVNKLAEMVHAILPDISLEVILAHEVWYKKYLDLKEKQKNSIKNWKANKLKSVKEKQATSVKISSPPQSSLEKSFVDYSCKEEIRHKIALWKANKRVQITSQHEQKLLGELKRKESETLQKEKHQQTKKEVETWKKEKKTTEEAEKIRKEKMQLFERESRIIRANKLIKEFQSQDDHFIKRKMERRHIDDANVQLQVVKIKHEAPRDPERLFKPTKQWIMRTRSYSSDNAEQFLHLQGIPKLRIPEWRKNMV